MKKFVLSIAISAIFSITQAAILTVSNTTNTPGSPGQYTTLAAAYTASFNGDTLLIQGSPTNYGDLSIGKKLTLFGTGYNPQRDNPYPSTVGTITFNNNSSGSVVMGLKITASITFSNNIAISNYLFSRNRIEGGVTNGYNYGSVSDVKIINNVLAGVGGSYYSIEQSTNWVISNNIIWGSSTSFNQPTIFFKNNVFISTSGQCLSSIANATFSNNIFYQMQPSQGADMSMNSFNNNLTYNIANPILPFGTNVGSGNKSNMDPMFLNVPDGTITYTYNYRLNAASPAKNAGTDGTDIGITGGLYPMYQSATDILTGEPPLPKVTKLSLTNSSVPAGGTLQFNVKAKKVN